MTLRKAISILVVLAGIAVYFLPEPAGAPAGVWRAAAVVMVAIGLWATAALPEYFTTLIFLLLAVTLGGLAPEIAFSGFHSSGAWLIFGGLVIGHSVQSSGLGAQIAARLLRRVGESYLLILYGTVIAAAAMSFLVPSNSGRLVIMVPILLALSDRLGFSAGSNGRAGLVLAAAAGTLYPGFGVLPAALPNLIMLGAADSVHGIELRYGSYLFTHFPAMGITSIIALPLILRALLPDRPGTAKVAAAPRSLARPQVTLAVLLIVALVLWSTDFVHGVSPAWIALGVALLCLMPGLGIGEPATLVSKINLGPWIFIAGVVSAGAIVSSSGLGSLIAEHLFAAVALTKGADFANFAIVTAIGMVMSLLSGVPGQPAIMTTLGPEIASGTGWPLATAIQSQVLSWALVLFPYQLPPMILAIQIGGVQARHLIRLMVSMTVLGWVVMLPLTYFWWRMNGLFGS